MIGRHVCKRVVVDHRGDFVRGENSHRRRDLKLCSERLLGTSQHIASPLGRHRENDVTTVEQRAHIAKSETFK